MKLREKNDLIVPFKVMICVNKNYVNLAVKLRYPDYMELYGIKTPMTMYWPKADPRAQEFRTWKCLFCPSRNEGFPLGRKKCQHIMFFFFKYEMKQNKSFSWNKNNYTHNNLTVSHTPLPV